MSEGRKDDSGKLPYHLIAPEVLEELSKVLEFGAKKYTINYETEWDRLLSVHNVEKLKLTIPTGVVALVTKKNLGELILSLPNGSDKIVGLGQNEILTKLRATPNVGKLIQNLVKETQEQSGLSTLKNTDFLKTDTRNSAVLVVPSAEVTITCTLTIATPQGDFEVSFVLNTIMDSDFWETTWKGLEKQFNISKPLNTVGSRNWEAGMDWSRVFSALQRHSWAWWRGEDKDPETGFSHLSHALCCLMFLSAYERRGVGNDDRPS